MILTKDTYRLILKILLPIVFTFFSAFIHAQQNDENTDTLRLDKLSEVDTAVNITPPSEEVTDYEEDSDVTGSEDSKENYFSPVYFHQSDSFILRKLPDSILKAMHDNDAFWYADKAFEKKQEQERRIIRGSFFDSAVFKTLLIIIIIVGFVVLLIMYLSGNSIGLFRKSKTIAEAESEEETENIFVINYQKEIDKAIAAANYRLAIRLMFLRILKRLADKKVIDFTQDKTNFDYLLQLHNTAWYENFFRITRNYEYAWYGQFEVDKEKFNVIQKEFDSFERKL